MPDLVPSLVPVFHTSMETTLPNGIMVYGDPSAFNRLSTVAESFPTWNDIGGVVDVPEDNWMPTDTKLNAKPDPAKVYPSGPSDRQVVDAEFDALHEQREMVWITEATSYACPVFVVWRTLFNGTRKGRVVVDIGGLNKISEFDALHMPLQTDIPVVRLRMRVYRCCGLHLVLSPMASEKDR